MSIKTSSRKYAGDPVLNKEGGDNDRLNYYANLLWAEKGGGGPSCDIVTEGSSIISFKENPLSVRTNHLEFSTNFNVYESSNYPDSGCILSGSSLGVKIGVWYDETITEEEIDRQTSILGGPFTNGVNENYPGDITQFITQPNDPNYTGSVYVTIKYPSGYSNSNVVVGDFSNYQYEKKI